jgi:cardiolipin synthase A/B
MRRRALLVVAAAGAIAAHRRVFGIRQRSSWPPPADSVTPAEAQAATEAFAGTHANDAALPFAWATAATLEPWAEGTSFFPRIFADVEAARSSVHILMFGWREGKLGMRMAELLERKLADGVEVRAIVDNLGSKPRGAAKAMYAGLAEAGAQIQVHDFRDNPGRVDHRKLYVIDGAVAWTGGAGIEDHFEDGRFHDVMVRVTGDVVRQAQAAFLTSFRGQGGTLPADLSHLFPAPADPGATPVVLAQVIPGGFVAAPDALREQIEGARERLDVMNPYFTDKDMVERILAAARRGVRVRVVVSAVSNNGMATAALKHRYSDLREAGAELWEMPNTVVHAKVVVADDTVSFGTVNLDAWALYRNSEIMILARSAELAALFEERLFEPDIARCTAGVAPATARERAESWVADKITYYL